MNSDVIMPALGMSQDTGKIVRWLKAEGDAVVQGEIIALIETDKASFDLEAPASGVLDRLLASEGADVPVGDVIATVGASEGQAEQASAAQAIGRPSSAKRPKASPKARRLARDQGIDLASIAGTGPGGAVVARDVTARERPPVLLPTSTAITRDSLDCREIPGAGSTTARYAFVAREIDAASLLRWRAGLQRRVAESLEHVDLYLRVVAEVLGGRAMRDASLKRVDIAFSVLTDGQCRLFRIDGVEGLEVEEIAGRRAGLLAAGRTAAGLAGAAITIHDAGAFEVDAAGALLEPPDVPVLSFGRVAERVLAANGTPTVRPTVQMTLSYDPRSVDSAWAAAFVQEISALLEEPLSLLA